MEMTQLGLICPQAQAGGKSPAPGPDSETWLLRVRQELPNTLDSSPVGQGMCKQNEYPQENQ